MSMPPPKRYNFQVGSGWKKQGQYGEYLSLSIDPEKMTKALSINQGKNLAIKLRDLKNKKTEKSPDISIECQSIFVEQDTSGAWIPFFEQKQQAPRFNSDDEMPF